MCTGPLFPISSYSALFIPLKPSFLGKGHQSSIICIIFIKILQIFFPILSTSLKIGIQITLCRKMWLLSRSALAQRSSSLLLRSASLSTPLASLGTHGRTQHPQRIVGDACGAVPCSAMLVAVSSLLLTLLSTSALSLPSTRRFVDILQNTI